MNDKEFSEQIHKLKQVYGDRYYPDGRVRLIWSEFKHLGAKDFEAGIDKLILEKRQAPLIDEFRAVFAISGASGRQARIQQIKAANYCDLCGNTGVISFASKTYRCSCPLGEAGLLFSGMMPRWETTTEKTFNG